MGISREDFCFTVGYNGEQAVVDKQARNRYGKMSVENLLKEGLFKPALCAALYDNDENGMKLVLKTYNEKSLSSLETVDELKRVFGVFIVPNDIRSVKTV